MVATAESTVRQLNEQVAAELHQGHFPQALSLATRACEQARSQQGEGSGELAYSLSQLAEAHRELGQFSQAESPCLQALNIRGALGKERPEYANSLNDLARLYEAMGNYPQAESLYQSALDIRRRALGEGHPDYAQTLHDLGILYDLLGRTTQAEPLIREALEIRRRTVGEEHADYAQSLMAVARIEMALGGLAEGEQLFRRAHEIIRTAQGEQHPEFARSLNVLASIAAQKGNLVEAQRLAARSADLRHRLLGENHPDHAGSLEMLAQVRCQQGPDESAEAEALAQQALEILRQSPGEKHAYYVGALETLAYVLWRTRKLAEAEARYCEALELARGLFGETAAVVRHILTDLAGVLCEQKRPDEGESLLREALTIARQAANKTSEVAVLLGLSQARALQKDLDGARSLAEEAEERCRAMRPESPLMLAGTLLARGHVERAAGEVEKAEALYRQTMEVCGSARAKDEHVYREALLQLVGCCQGGDRLAALVPLTQEMLQVTRRTLGENNPETAEWVRALAALYQEMGNQPAAESLWKQVLEEERRRGGEKTAGFARALRNLAHYYFQTFNFAAAEVRYRQVLASRMEREGQDHPEVAESLTDLGALYHQGGDLATAEPFYRKALEVRRVDPGEDSPEFAHSLHNLALVLQATGRLDEAEPLFRQALEIHDAATGEESPGYIVGLQSMALFFQARGKHDRAVADLQRALELGRKVYGKRSPLLAQLLRDLARVHGSVGDHLAAEPFLRQALEINRSFLGAKHPTHAADLVDLSVPYRLLGDYAQAEPLLQKALEVIRSVRGAEHPETGAYLTALASLYYVLERYDRAEELYRQSLEVYRAAVPNHPAVAGCLSDLAGLYLTLGRRKEAEAHYQEALAALKKALGEENLEYANGLRVLAEFHRAAGDFRAADPLLRQHLDITRRLCPENHPFVAMSLQLRAVLERSRRNFTAAASGYQQALEMVQRSAPLEGGLQSPLLKGLAVVHLMQGNYKAAEPPLRQALRLEQKSLGQEHPEYAGSLHLLAGLCAATGREAEAVTLLEQLTVLDERAMPAVLALQSVRSRAGCYQPLDAHWEVYLSLVFQHLADAPEAVGKALDLVLRRKASWVEALAVCRKSLLEEQYPDQRARIEELYFLRRQAAARRWTGPGPEGLATHERLLSDWEDRAARLEAELAEHVPELAIQRRLRTADRRAVADALRAGSALIEFVRVPVWDFRKMFTQIEPAAPPARYLAFVLTAGQPDAVKLIDLGAAETIDRLVTNYRAALGRGAGPERASTLAAAGTALRVAVFDKLAPSLDGCQRLVVSGDGDLVRVPLQTLLTEDGAYLIDRYTISYVHTGRDLLRDPAPPPGTASPPVILGDPDFGEMKPTPDAGAAALAKGTFWSRVWTTLGRLVTLGFSKPDRESARCPAPGGLRFDSLPGTREEAEQIAELFGVRPWLGGEAEKSRLTACRSPRVLHLATHAFALGQPSSEGAPLTNASPEAVRPGHWENPLRRAGLALAGANPDDAEGRLSAWDVSGLDLGQTEVVVLPAGSSTDEAAKAGAAVALPRSFVLAGARAVLANLWPVPDGPRRKLLADFYRRVLAGQSSAEALREAQRACRAAHADPARWGAFVCFGNRESG
jgi:tetratricopeptide (TPR) repeat protein/CHAT domain-containing protein